MRNRSQPTRQARVGQHAASGRRPPGLRQNLRSARGASACGFSPALQTKTPHLGAAARAWLISSGESACVVDIRRMRTELLTHRVSRFSAQPAACGAARRTQGVSVRRDVRSTRDPELAGRQVASQAPSCPALLAGDKSVSDCSLFWLAHRRCPLRRHRRFRSRPNVKRDSA